MSLGEINEEIFSIFSTYKGLDLRSKMLEFIRKDLRDKMESLLEKQRRLENLELMTKHNHKGQVTCPHCRKEFTIR